MAKTSFWILLVVLAQIVLCSVFLFSGGLNARTLGGGIVTDMARIFEFNGVVYLSLAVVAFACFSQESRLGKCVGWIALGVMSASILNHVAGTILDYQGRHGLGWVLYPPLGSEGPASFFQPNDPSATDLMVRLLLKAILQTLSIALSLMGCAVILGKRYRAQSMILLICLGLAAFGMWSTVILWNGGSLSTQWPLFLLIGLLLIIGLTTPNWRTRLDTHYALGAVALIAIMSASFAGLQFRTQQFSGGGSAYQDTYYVVSGPSYWVGIVPIFLLFAGLIVWLRPTLRPLLTGLHAFGLMIAIAIATTPATILFEVPRRYVDFDPLYRTVALVQGSAGLIAFALIIAGIVVMILRRAR